MALKSLLQSIPRLSDNQHLRQKLCLEITEYYIIVQNEMSRELSSKNKSDEC